MAAEKILNKFIELTLPRPKTVQLFCGRKTVPEKALPSPLIVRKGHTLHLASPAAFMA